MFCLDQKSSIEKNPSERGPRKKEPFRPTTVCPGRSPGNSPVVCPRWARQVAPRTRCCPSPILQLSETERRVNEKVMGPNIRNPAKRTQKLPGLGSGMGACHAKNQKTSERMSPGSDLGTRSTVSRLYENQTSNHCGPGIRLNQGCSASRRTKEEKRKEEGRH
jgi:hypothetical protein